ncbi:hypothetical protein [Moritella sp. F3]|uniref:hypothetical protein n=1 Tax=Moritella sp. F3 TaxID=2718882 RepID=UPI0018E18602|nr:hypothetical protein [Moritella sp. F3]GIC77218.1 hypothetical protein FMO001_19450 [Moritella sp. F1]GIC82337.1 hypothetical protein FMO003_26180 [Moritella sp. F3]
MNATGLLNLPQNDDEHFNKLQRGFTAIETFIVLGVIILIAIGVAKNIGPMQVEYKVYQITNQASTIHAGASSWAGGGVYTGVSMALLKDDYIPSDFVDGKGINPYNGDVTATANTDPYNLDITFLKIKNDAGVRTVKKYGSTYASYDKATKTLVLTMQG